MGKPKLTIEFVSDKFEKEGYTLLTKIYEGCLKKLEYICPKGHRDFTVWSNWQQGYRCPECSRKKKKNIESIRVEFEREGYKLLTTEYKNNSQKLKYMCPKGHIGYVRYVDWRYSKNRCSECSRSKKKNIIDIKKAFEVEGFTLLTTVYKNSKHKLEYICPNGHKGTVTWSDWQSKKSRCAECSNIRKKTIEEIRKAFEKEGYQLLTTTYKNSKRKLEYICPKGHRSNIAWTKWKQGERCFECSIISRSGENNHRWRNYTNEEIKEFKVYRANITQITNQNFCKYYYIINSNKLKRDRNNYHLDHIYSVKDGYDNGIPPEVIASPINLQMLPAKKNISKSNKSYITKEELFSLYKQFQKEIL